MNEVMPNEKGDAMLNDVSIELDAYTNVAVNNVGASFCNIDSRDQLVVRHFRMGMSEFQSSTDMHSVSVGYLHVRAKSGLRGR